MTAPHCAAHNRRRYPWPVILILRRKWLVLCMGILGGIGGLAISQLAPKVYYSRVLVQVKQDRTCGLSAGRPTTFDWRMYRSFNSAAKKVGLPKQKSAGW
ncbi:MAG: Wzz/FepE/Etk N-terminal domain-containing protein [Verrucomicrobiota bacterium]